MSMAVLETTSSWSSIQSQIMKQEPSIQKQADPYIDPWLKHNPCVNLSQRSLEICTERLCSETGCEDYFDPDFLSSSSSSSSSTSQHSKSEFSVKSRKGIKVSAKRKSFPPPLSSMSRPDGTSGMKMKAHRFEGRLIVQAVSVPDHNNMDAQRHGGRLLLTFKPTTASVSVSQEENGTVEDIISTHKAEKEDKYMEENHETGNESASLFCHVKQPSSDLTTSEASLAASVSPTSECEGSGFGSDDKPLFTSKWKNKEEHLHDMRRCNDLRNPLFTWDPGCIATSS